MISSKVAYSNMFFDAMVGFGDVCGFSKKQKLKALFGCLLMSWRWNCEICGKIITLQNSDECSLSKSKLAKCQ